MPDSGPEEVVHEGTEMVSSVQPEVVETEQSPQLEIIKMILERPDLEIDQESFPAYLTKLPPTFLLTLIKTLIRYG